MNTEQANHSYVLNCSNSNKKHLTSLRMQLVNLPYSSDTVSQTTLVFSTNK